MLITTSEDVRNDATVLEQEIFGPATVIVEYRSEGELEELASLLGGQLTATIQAEPDEQLTGLVSALRGKSGRVLWNGWPTGVTVSYAQHHGGPYPATTAPHHLRGHRLDRPVHAAGGLPVLPGSSASTGPARGESLGHRPPGGRPPGIGIRLTP